MDSGQDVQSTDDLIKELITIQTKMLKSQKELHAKVSKLTQTIVIALFFVGAMIYLSSLH